MKIPFISKLNIKLQKRTEKIKNCPINSYDKKNEDRTSPVNPKLWQAYANVSEVIKHEQRYEDNDGIVQTVITYFNPETGKQSFTPSLFFVNMPKYGKNYEWAADMSIASDKASTMIENKKTLKEVLNFIVRETAAAQINAHQRDEGYGKYYGKYTEVCEKEPEEQTFNERYCLKTPFAGKYKLYKARIAKLPFDEQGNYSVSPGRYKDALVTLISNDNYMYHPNGHKNLDYAEEIYNSLLEKENPSEDEINEAVASIHWLIVQNVPFQRGTDSITHILAKSIYKAYNMEVTPLKEGISIDIEAFLTDFEDFIKKYPSFYAFAPKKIIV